MDKSEIGRLGEDFVCMHLASQGYTIAERNYRIRGGEIDIIAMNEEYLVFVEVKSRKPGSLVSGFDAVDKRKKGLIIKTASDYCCKHPNQLQPRFDIAQVTISGARVLGIDYIQNAFDTTGYNYIF